VGGEDGKKAEGAGNEECNGECEEEGRGVEGEGLGRHG
jgi:hypothetical protein